MAKVYDALRRAEAERRKRDDEPTPAVPRLGWEPEVAIDTTSAPKPVRESLFRRLWPRTSASSGEGSGDFNKRRISLLQPDSYVAEQFRALRGRIDAMEGPDRPLRTIAVASALPGEGKTTASINLALVTGLSLGRSVLLIDCDMRHARVHSALGLRPECGLADVLTGDAKLDDAILKVEGANLDVLPSRGQLANPSELLGSQSMRDLVAEVSRRYQRVILDTPAALGLPDAKAVGDLCDGIVLVVRANQTRHEDLRSALEILDRSRVIGMVLNGADDPQGRYGYYSR